MDEMKDRRSFNRLEYPGKTAFLVNTGWYYILRYRLFYTIALLILGKTLLQNISASGSCILSNNNFKPGNVIKIIINAPGEKSIFIKGKVRWISSDTQDNVNHVGIQFLAYGNGKKYNSYKVLEQLHIYAFQTGLV